MDGQPKEMMPPAAIYGLGEVVNQWIIIILYYAIYGSTQAYKYKKAKIHLKYDLKYKKDMNTNIKAHRSAR